MAPKLIKGSHLTDRKIRQLIELFVLEVPAAKAARRLAINRHTAERIYARIRLAIAYECEREAPLDGEIEVDESYFGGYRKGLRGRATAGKVAVFGLLKRKGRVYTRPVPNVSREVLRAIIRQKVPPGSTIYSDSFASYEGLITDGYRHYRINHGREFARGKRNHINGIENFWAFAKAKLRRYYGVRRTHFFLYLKEMEFRFNHRHEDLPLRIKKILKHRG
jgi:transposase-like protein